jgi:transcriptional regulator with XRE-family HTH domain
MSAATVEFDFEDVLPTVQRAHSRANRDDAEEAIQTAVTEMLERGERLAPGFVVHKARSRLINALELHERRNSSLDAFRESDVDQAPVELAIEEVDFEAHARLAEAASNPILRRRLEAAVAGGSATLQPRGEAAHGHRYGDDVVRAARRLRDEQMGYEEIAERLGVASAQTIAQWCKGRSRRSRTRAGWDCELVYEAIRAFHREEGRRPTFRDFIADPRLPGLYVLERLGLRILSASAAAGIPAPASVPEPWDRAAVLGVYRDFHRREGRWPLVRERRACNGFPGQKATQRVLGTTAMERIAAMVEDVAVPVSV